MTALRSATGLLPAFGFMALRKGRPAPSISIAAAKMPSSLRMSSFSNTASLFQGLMVGTPMPPTLAMAAAERFMISGSTPSPVKEAEPHSTAVGMRMSL